MRFVDEMQPGEHPAHGIIKVVDLQLDNVTPFAVVVSGVDGGLILLVVMGGLFSATAGFDNVLVCFEDVAHGVHATFIITS